MHNVPFLRPIKQTVAVRAAAAAAAPGHRPHPAGGPRVPRGDGGGLPARRHHRRRAVGAPVQAGPDLHAVPGGPLPGQHALQARVAADRAGPQAHHHARQCRHHDTAGHTGALFLSIIYWETG